MADTSRVLYVDDEPTLLEMAKLFLEKGGAFAVDTLTSAGMALDRLNKEQYDAIISDYQMPEIDGIEFLKRVRASGNTIPFILFTGRGREEVVIQALNEGADFYLQKGGDPVSQFTELSHQIQQVIQHRRAEENLRESEGRFEAFMDHLPVTAFIKDEKFKNLFVNRRMEEIFGAKEWIGKSVCDLFPKDAAEKMIEDDRQTLIDGYRKTIEKLVAINGDKKVVETYKFRIDRENKPPLIGGFAVDITEQQQERQALYENEQRLTSIFNTVGDVIFQLAVGPDEQYHFTSVNSAFSRTTGLPPEQVIDRNVKEIIPEPSLSIVLEKYRQAIEKRAIVHWEETSSYPTGQLIGEVRIAPIFDEAGTCTHLIGSVHDITERKRSEEALRASEEKFRSLAESSPDYIMRYDRQCRHTYMNPAALRASGLTEEQIIGKTHRESGFDETQSQFWEEKIIQVFETGQPYQSQFTWESVDGCIVLDWMLTPEFTDDGTVRSVLGVSRDITQLKRAEEELLKKNEELSASYEEIASSEEELRANLNTMTEQEVALKESEAKFRDFFNNTGDAIAIHDMQGHFLEVNDEICRRLGYSREELLNMSPGDIDEPEYGNKVQARIQELQQTGHVVFETVHRTKDGTGIPTEVSSRMIVYNGKPAIISNGRDITERKWAEKALHQVNHQLNILSSITRHDILNKIMVALGFLQITEVEVKDPKIAEYLQKIHSGITAIRSQIEFTRVYQDLGTNEPQWIDLDTIIPRQLVPSTITLKADAKGVQIFSDPMLEKVMFNLLDNSIMHGERVNEIQISYRPSGVDLVVVWEDNGVGIADDEKERIFERGFGKNTGYGLFLAREILSLTDITMKENGVPGKGARFEIVVPKGMFRYS